MRKEFDDAGVRVAIVSGTDMGAKEFVEAVWKEGELFIDDDEAFKRALGGEKYKNWWILKPWVLSQMRSLAFMPLVAANPRGSTSNTSRKLSFPGPIEMPEVED